MTPSSKSDPDHKNRNPSSGSTPKRVDSGVVVSGMRPTGRLHLGHFFGALERWLELQKNGQYACYFMSADWHALTTGYRETSDLRTFRREMFADWLAVGIDPDRSTLFSQAAIQAHAELALLLGMITPMSWLERVPSYKELRQALHDRDLSTIGFLGYPLLQTADIGLYLGTHVPVGEDQLAHVELAREIVRRFNNFYGPVFPEPRGLLTPTRRLAGIDGRKMSKSYQNAVYLFEDKEDLKPKIMTAPTDPARVKRTDPGTPEKCTIFSYQKLLQTEDGLREIDSGCRTAAIGCVDCKKKLLGRLEVFQAPLREKRSAVLASGDLDDIIDQGNRRAASQAERTMTRVREAMELTG